MLTEDEKRFHKSRIAFAIINKDIYYLYDSELGHKEWLVESNMISLEQFKEIIRGFVKGQEIYFYRGDFITDKNLEKEAKEYVLKICYDLNIEVPDSICCGMTKGNIGEEWKPQKVININKCNKKD